MLPQLLFNGNPTAEKFNEKEIVKFKDLKKDNLDESNDDNGERFFFTHWFWSLSPWTKGIIQDFCAVSLHRVGGHISVKANN